MQKLLIANRGEIARRILKACREKNISAAVIATEEDKFSLVCREADAILEVDSFLNANQIIEQAIKWGAHFIHPGYGFLSENSSFAKLCEDNNIQFVGPTSAQIKQLGSKESAKKIARLCNVPTLSSLTSEELKRLDQAQWGEALNKLNICAPYLIKASGGGGGRGMRIVHNFSDIPKTLALASEEALSAFNDPTVFVERYMTRPRHIEIQVFGDGKGNGLFFGERECSLQRRHQKVIEECPSSIITDKLREEMGQASLRIVEHTKYRGAGTVEFLFDENQNYYFLEVNTRLQVEHPVTELVYNIDLVHAQLDLAQDIWPFKNLSQRDIQPKGCALEARILAEDPRQNFIPTPGTIEEYIEPTGEGVRIDSGVTKNSVILPIFDSMISKLIVYEKTRKDATEKLQAALREYVIFGITTNIPFLISLTSREEFKQGNESTHFIEDNLSALNESLISDAELKVINSFSYREKLFNTYHTQKNQVQIIKVFSNQKFNDQNPYYKTNNYFNENDNQSPTQKIYSYLNTQRNLELNIQGEHIILDNPGFYNQTFISSENLTREIKSPMGGKLLEVKAQENDLVQKGDLLFILESMKMQIEIRAPSSGQVKNIFVTKNEILSGQKTLALLIP